MKINSKSLCLIMISVFMFSYCIIPSAYSLTVEEQAGSKVKKQILEEQNDEFTKKTPARRDLNKISNEKDPRLACLLSLIIPGGGQIYLKKDLKGIGFFMLTTLGYSTSGYYLYKAITGDSSGTEKKSKLMISGLLFLVGVIFHAVGIVEAYNDAIEINEQKFYYGNNNSESPYIAKVLLK